MGKISSFLSTIESVVKKHDSAILTGFATAGLVLTAIAAFKAGPKVQKIMEEKKKDMKDVKKDDKEAKRAVIVETVKEVTPVVLPPIVIGTATAACIFGSHKISSRKIAVLSAAYGVTEKSVKELNSKMVEILGEKKTQSIKDAIIKDKVGEAPKDERGNVLVIEGGDVLCKDLYSGRFFRSNAQKINEAILKLSNDICIDMYVTLNDLYDYLDIPKIPLGEEFGWDVGDTVQGRIPIYFSAVLTEDKVPCLCVTYDIQVRPDFRNLHG